MFRSGGSRWYGFRRDSKEIAYQRFRGLQDVGESRPLRQDPKGEPRFAFFIVR